MRACARLLNAFIHALAHIHTCTRTHSPPLYPPPPPHPHTFTYRHVKRAVSIPWHASVQLGPECGQVLRGPRQHQEIWSHCRLRSIVQRGQRDAGGRQHVLSTRARIRCRQRQMRQPQRRVHVHLQGPQGAAAGFRICTRARVRRLRLSRARGRRRCWSISSSKHNSCRLPLPSAPVHARQPRLHHMHEAKSPGTRTPNNCLRCSQRTPTRM